MKSFRYGRIVGNFGSSPDLFQWGSDICLEKQLALLGKPKRKITCPRYQVCVDNIENDTKEKKCKDCPRQ